MKACPICAEPLTKEVLPTDQGGGLFFFVPCRRCKAFRITDEANDELGRRPLTPVNIGTASGWLRSGPRDFLITTGILADLRQMQPLPVGEQADRLLLHFSRENPQPAEEFEVPLSDTILQAVAWAQGEKHLIYLYKYLSEAERFLASGPGSGTHYKATITPGGWRHLYDLQHTKLTSSQGFVAMHFDETLDALRDQALLPAIADAGYEHFIVNKHPTNTDIMAEIIAAIRRSRFMVADFTNNRPAVYYEAGIAFGLGQQIVHTCQKGKLPEVAFDVNHNSFLLWEPDKLEDFRRALTFQIESTIGPGPRRTT